eukprot:TRINITY_DN5753_c0_g2_i1.p1 TRINITY_DN5753_c0_g2~~TRINITY_DN5753_c0_g2_i1.p1  ORF type:complete len:211 (+),score=47.62 TRINITY_DN5753_c0_g2_i1:69-701(+)
MQYPIQQNKCEQRDYYYMKGKKVLVVYTHPNPKSFSHAILETTLEALKAKNYEIMVRDLHEIKFNPILTRADIDAMKEKKMPKDIEEEQKYISWCDTIIFVHPLWWGSLPAMLKGYFDRVFAKGFAYTEEGCKLKGLLNKEVAVFQPQGGGKSRSESYIWPAIDVITKKSTFEACGLKILGYLRFPSVLSCTQEVRVGYLNEVKEFCAKI